MNRRQKLVQQQFLNNEKAVLRQLKKSYNDSLVEINDTVKNLQLSIDGLQQEYDWMDDNDPQKAIVKSKIQSKIYQKQYQEQLQSQVGGILSEMQRSQFVTVSDYLDKCYEDGFVGSIFDLHGQGVPLTMPINQESMVKAVQLDSKISKGLYTKLGEDVDVLKKRITSEVTRAIATGATYAQTAQRLAGQTKIGYNKAARIARTEGHRIQNSAADDAAHLARDRGADVVKQWDATLDGHTRDSHVAVDGQIRELDEEFGNGLMFPGDPRGPAAEVVNCRCSYLQRARWALEGSFTKMNNFTGQIETFDSPQDYEEFKKAFFSDENKKYMNYVEQLQDKYGTKDFTKMLGNMSDREYKHYSKLLQNNPVYNKKSTGKLLTNSGKSNASEQFGDFKKKYLNPTNESENQYGFNYGEKAVDVDWDYIQSASYREKFNRLTDGEGVNNAIYDATMEILSHCDGTTHEDLYLFDFNGNILSKVTDSVSSLGVNYTDDFKKALKDSIANNTRTIALHNHPEGTPPSADDFRKAYDNRYSMGIVSGHNGQLYVYSNDSIEISQELSAAMAEDIAYCYQNGIDIDRASEMVYNAYGLFYRIV